MTRLPGRWPGRFAVGLRGFSTWLPALTKNWPASMRATLRADPPPARRCHTGTPRAKAKSQEPRAKARTKAKSQSAQRRRIGNAKRALALSPQRFGRVAQGFGVSAVWRRKVSRNNAPQPFRLIPSLCCEALALEAIFFGLLFFYSGHSALRPSGRLRRSHALRACVGQQKKSDSSVPRGLASRRRQTIETPAA
jgi:hypothetical protein